MSSVRTFWEKASVALAKAYAAMLADEVIVGNTLSFDDLLKTCAKLAAEINDRLNTMGNDDQNCLRNQRCKL